MKLSFVVFGVLATCAVSYALEYGPLVTALQPILLQKREAQPEKAIVLLKHPRQKRGLVIGHLAAGALGAGLLGAGAVGAGVLGAGVLGAKVGLVGGALAATALSRSHHGNNGYDSHGYGYDSHDYGYDSHDHIDHESYDPAYYGSGYEYYGGHRSYPTEYYVEEQW